MITYTNELYLIFFLPVCLAAYQVCPRRQRGKCLIAADYFFLYLACGWVFLYLPLTSLATHAAGLAIESSRQQGRRGGRPLILALVLLFGALAVFRYSTFLGQNLTALAAGLGREGLAFRPLHLLVPAGLSFYTLEAAGYLADVYRGRVQASRSLEQTLLFLSFFPKLLTGPILRWQEAGTLLAVHEGLEADNIEAGSVRIIWGLFKYFIITVRFGTVADAIFANYANYYGIVIVLAAVFYTIQFYIGFSAIMDICLGTARLFGIVLPENFRQPFFARGAADFWQRWHVTLAAWFRDYVYEPLTRSRLFGASRMGRALGPALCLLVTWLALGLWHGGRWTYVFYGFYYFVILLLGSLLEPAWAKCCVRIGIRREAVWYRLAQFGKLAVMVVLGQLIFRADSMTAAWSMIKSIFAGPGVWFIRSQLLFHLGIDWKDWLVALIGLALVAVYSFFKETRGFDLTDLQGLRTLPKWLLYLGFILTVVVFGAYGDGYRVIRILVAR